MISGGMNGAVLAVLALIFLIAMIFVSGVWVLILGVAVIAYMANALCLLSRGGFFGDGYVGIITAILSLMSVRAMLYIAFTMLAPLYSIILTIAGIISSLVFRYPGCAPLPNTARYLRIPYRKCIV